jgi:ubiquinone/menaquinone biosynthesis C-methylase UbiE
MSLLSLHNFLIQPSFEFQDGLYYQKNIQKEQLFESTYTALRKLEGRLYDDSIVAKLPNIGSSHPKSKEWVVRKRSAMRLIKSLKSKPHQTIVEVGCGNGWLIHSIQSELGTNCLGLDINEIELKQASRLFGRTKGLNFMYGDILSENFETPFVDALILASAIQYFPDAKILIEQLLKMLNPGGQIHILDSPIYTESTKEDARQRSEKYFKEMGQEEMRLHYFHHTWEELKQFNYSVQYNPTSTLKRFLQIARKDSPFPWIIIER